MIYADGAGAVLLEAVKNSDTGIISHHAQTHASKHALLLTMDKSYNLADNSNDTFIKMNDRALYEFALSKVPQVVKQTLDKAQVHLSEVKSAAPPS